MTPYGYMTNNHVNSLVNPYGYMTNNYVNSLVNFTSDPIRCAFSLAEEHGDRPGTRHIE